MPLYAIRRDDEVFPWVGSNGDFVSCVRSARKHNTHADATLHLESLKGHALEVVCLSKTATQYGEPEPATTPHAPGPAIEMWGIYPATNGEQK